MKYVVEIPEEIEQALEQRASATGDDVARLIQIAVVSFVRGDAHSSPHARRPDLPAAAVEIAAPCELPRPSPIPIQKQAHRYPDSIVDPA